MPAWGHVQLLPLLLTRVGFQASQSMVFGLGAPCCWKLWLNGVICGPRPMAFDDCNAGWDQGKTQNSLLMGSLGAQEVEVQGCCTWDAECMPTLCPAITFERVPRQASCASGNRAPGTPRHSGYDQLLGNLTLFQQPWTGRPSSPCGGGGKAEAQT